MFHTVHVLAGSQAAGVVGVVHCGTGGNRTGQAPAVAPRKRPASAVVVADGIARVISGTLFYEGQGS